MAIRKRVRIRERTVVKQRQDNEQIARGQSDADELSRSQDSFDRTILRALRYQIGGKYTAQRNLFLKADLVNSCAITVANIPMFIELETVRKILTHSLDVPAKGIALLRRSSEGAPIAEGYYMATVSFEDEYAVAKVLKICESVPVVCLAKYAFPLAPCGSTRYCREYKSNFKSVDQLQHDVDSYVKSQDERISEEKRNRKRKGNVPDADGWITVTKSRYKRLPAAVVVKSKDDLLKKSKRKSDEIPFYSFQITQSKAKHLDELRKKFAEDKKKLAIAKAARKFRPT